MRVCAAHGVPIVTRGAGTGVSGGANAVDGCVVLSTERMNTIVEIDPGERLAVVQAGVVNDDLRKAAAEQGLWYPPDPSSAPWSTIGGNVGTNAGGLCCVKYGVTRDYVLALEVVLASGEIVRLGRRTAKGVTGYDMVGLMVGSEGTLGVVTEATVRLRPARSAPTRTIVGFFDTLEACGRAVAGVTTRGLEPAMFELIDQHTLAAVNEWKHAGLATCTRCSSHRAATTRHGNGRRTRSPGSSPPHSKWAAPSPASTASDWSSSTACAASWAPRSSRCSGRSSTPSIRSAS